MVYFSVLALIDLYFLVLENTIKCDLKLNAMLLFILRVLLVNDSCTKEK